MASFLLDWGNVLLTPAGVKLARVRVWETENCYADAHA
jgi:hypothetical protein